MSSAGTTTDKSNLFYIYWVDVSSGEKQTTWHKETEPVVKSSTVYEG